MEVLRQIQTPRGAAAGEPPKKWECVDIVRRLS